MRIADIVVRKFDFIVVCVDSCTSAKSSLRRLVAQWMDLAGCLRRQMTNHASVVARLWQLHYEHRNKSVGPL